MVNILSKRLALLERIINKMPPLALECDYSPNPEQIAQISRAEALGRRVFLYMQLPSTVWTNGVPKHWETGQCD